MAVLITASSKIDLFSSLRDIDITVPGRESGRTHEHKETWAICRLLSSLAHAGMLTYPLAVKHATPPDPDFILSMGDSQVGVEVTEATSEHYSEYLNYIAKRNEERPKASFPIIEPASFRPGAWKRARKMPERIEMMEAEANKCRLTSPGWLGNEPEREWADYVFEAAQQKFEKAPKYRFKTLWLSVYQNAPLPAVNYNEALSLLRPRLQDSWNLEAGFVALCIEDRSSIICVNKNGHKIIPVHNLWRDGFAGGMA